MLVGSKGARAVGDVLVRYDTMEILIFVEPAVKPIPPTSSRTPAMSPSRWIWRCQRHT